MHDIRKLCLVHGDVTAQKMMISQSEPPTVVFIDPEARSEDVGYKGLFMDDVRDIQHAFETVFSCCTAGLMYSETSLFPPVDVAHARSLTPEPRTPEA